MSFFRIAVLACCTSVVTLPAWAEKPDFAGGHKAKWEQDDKPGRDKPQHAEREERPDAGRNAHAGPGNLANRHFGDRERGLIQQYYAPKVSSGKCPPGLAKKNNGCLPPGQAKKWALGQALPSGVVRYPLPADLLRRLGPPPAGHEYVRVAGDILLLTIGTSMVIDAIENLGGF